MWDSVDKLTQIQFSMSVWFQNLSDHSRVARSVKIVSRQPSGNKMGTGGGGTLPFVSCFQDLKSPGVFFKIFQHRRVIIF